MKYRRSTQALHAEVGEDVVALQVQRGMCFGMENVTADVWRLLVRESSIEEICDQLVDQYDVDQTTCRKDVRELVELMIEEGLVETVG